MTSGHFYAGRLLLLLLLLLTAAVQNVVTRLVHEGVGAEV
jgi:hypothetical protein